MSKSGEYFLICYGYFEDINEARRALEDPFIEEFVEETGKFSFHDLENIRVTNRISLSDLEISFVEDGVWHITCPDAQVSLNFPKAEKLAETLRQYVIFDEIVLEHLG